MHLTLHCRTQMSNAIGLWLPVLFLANVVALFLVILGRKSIKPKLSRSNTGRNSLPPRHSDFAVGPPKDDVIVETSDSIAPITLVWKNVNCCVGAGTTQKKVLAGVYGRALPGEVSVIMGPSGAGKSTLLDVLSFRKKTGKTTGDIIVNGELRAKDFTSIASYVPQVYFEQIFFAFYFVEHHRRTISFLVYLVLKPCNFTLVFYCTMHPSWNVNSVLRLFWQILD